MASSPEPMRVVAWPMPELRLDTEGMTPPAPETPSGPSVEDEAYARGMEEGWRQATEDADRLTRSARRTLAAAAESLQAARTAFASEAEASVYALAVAVAQQIVQRELTTDPAIVRDFIRRALELVPLDGAIEIRLNPADLAALGSDLAFYAPGGRTLDVRWVAEPSLAQGDYVIESAQRVVDGRIDPVLRATYGKLRDG